MLLRELYEDSQGHRWDKDTEMVFGNGLHKDYLDTNTSPLLKELIKEYTEYHLQSRTGISFPEYVNCTFAAREAIILTAKERAEYLNKEADVVKENMKIDENKEPYE